MSNLDLWDKLAKTDPDHTKKFQRAGGFSGTAVKPIYTELKMTEEFGPCGVGWGISEPSFITVPTGDEVLVYCTVSIWYAVADGSRSAPVFGVGGDLAVKKFNNGKIAADDEAFKKAFTDAIGNAMKHLGMSADVHMGQHDDSKYVTGLRKEIADKAKGEDDRTPKQICDDFLDLVRELTDVEEYRAAWRDEQSVLKKIQRVTPEVYNTFIMDLHKVLKLKGFDGSSKDAPDTGGKREDNSSGGDSVSKQKAMEMWAAWKESPHITGLETSMKQAGFLTVGEDGWVVKPDSVLGVIRENDRGAFDTLSANTDKLRVKMSKGKAA